jgi:hypothetical protein
MWDNVGSLISHNPIGFQGLLQGWLYFYFTLLYFTLLYFTLLYFTLLYFTLLLNVAVMYSSCVHQECKPEETCCKCHMLWGWERRFSPKRFLPSTKLHSFTSLKILTALGISNLIKHERYRFILIRFHSLKMYSRIRLSNLTEDSQSLNTFSIALSRIESSNKDSRYRVQASLNRPQYKLTASNGADELWPSGIQSYTIQSAGCGVSHMNLVVISVLWYWLLCWWRIFEGDVGVKIICSTIQNLASLFIIVYHIFYHILSYILLSVIIPMVLYPSFIRTHYERPVYYCLSIFLIPFYVILSMLFAINYFY